MFWREKTQWSHGRYSALSPNPDDESASLPSTNLRLTKSERGFSTAIYALIILSLILNILTVGFGFTSKQHPDTKKKSLTDGTVSALFESALGFNVPPGYPGSKWESISPPGSGFVHLPDAASVAHLSGTSEGNYLNYSPNGTYCVAMFHQLHCLATLKLHMYVISNGGYAVAASESLDHGVDPEHIDHCFDYLRQSIMCSGDTTLEPAQEGVALEGWGVTHQCRNFYAVKRFVDDHSLGDVPVVDELRPFPFQGSRKL